MWQPQLFKLYANQRNILRENKEYLYHRVQA
jgi:hypothetical protein